MTPPPSLGSTAAPVRREKRRAEPRVGASLLARGEPMVWLTGGGLAISVFMIVGLLVLVAYNGFSAFWPRPLEQVTLHDGRPVLGRVTRENRYTPPPSFFDGLSGEGLAAATVAMVRTGQAPALESLRASEPALADAVAGAGVASLADLTPEQIAGLSEESQRSLARVMVEHDGLLHRRLFNDANFDLDNEHFTWVHDFEVAEGPTTPAEAIIMDRYEQREFIGFPVAFAVDGLTTDEGFDAVMAKYHALHDGAMERRAAARSIEKHDIGHLNALKQQARLGVIDARLAHGADAVETEMARDAFLLTSLDVDAAPATLLSVASRMNDAEAAGQSERVAALASGLEEWVARNPETHGQAVEIARSVVRQSEAIAAAARESVLNVTAELQSAVISGANGLAELTQLPLVGEMHALKERIAELRSENARYVMHLQSAQGADVQIGLGDVHTVVASNQLGFGDKVGVYLSRWWGYLTEEPREANMAGGIFPHIVGTVLMVIIMCVLVVPFGVLAALYIREYAKAGFVVSAIRVAINNLAGVPSIVYGVFGLGFFIYIVGAYMDGGPANAEMPILPTGQWFGLLGGFAAMVLAGAGATYLNRRTFIDREQRGKVPGNLAAGLVMAGAWAFVLWQYLAWWATATSVAGVLGRLLVGGVIVAVVFLAARPIFTDVNDRRSVVSRVMYLGGILTCILGALAGVALVATTPFFGGFANAHVAINTPFWGKGALIWASFTLALLTLPVVIVATEEALSAVPNSMREGSYACGASKWQTIKRIVLPRAMPGIMTGTILAMARGAGEVAPLMIVGVVAFTQELPASTDASEAFGINRSFLHLGFHIYNMGFQSQDSEGAKPLVYVTTLLLIVIVAVLNLSAIYLRSRLKRRFVSSAF